MRLVRIFSTDESDSSAGSWLPFLFLFARRATGAHVYHANGEAKFWLEPTIELAHDYGLGPTRINVALKIVEEHQDEIRAAWAKHFGR